MTTTTIETRFAGLVSGVWAIDPAHSEVGFTVRHLMSRVRGQFRSFEGAVTIGENPLDSSALATIDLSSVDTGNADRDTHLRSSDFFSVDTTPKMTFVSTGIRLDGDGAIVSGDLTIKDVTKPVELSVEFLGTDKDAAGSLRVGFEATTEISRKEWGITFNVPLEGDKVMIGDKVAIVLAIEAVHQG